MKNKLKSLILISTLIFMISCGSDDPKKNAEKAGECACKLYDLEKEALDIEYDLLKTYKKKKEKEKDKDSKRGDSRGDDYYHWVKVVDDWDEHANLQSKMTEIEMKASELEKNMAEYRMQAYKASDNQDDYDDWIEDFEEAVEDYVDDNCKDAEEDLEEDWEKYRKKEDNYFEIPEEEKDHEDY